MQSKYEWNFGASFNWDTYDPATNPSNKNIGAWVNIYFAANIFSTKFFSKHIDMEFGLSGNHISNGATKMPNSAINTIGVSAGLIYYFERERNQLCLFKKKVIKQISGKINSSFACNHHNQTHDKAQTLPLRSKVLLMDGKHR